MVYQSGNSRLSSKVHGLTSPGQLSMFLVPGMISHLSKLQVQLESSWLAPTCGVHLFHLYLSRLVTLWFTDIAAGEDYRLRLSFDSLHSTFWGLNFNLREVTKRNSNSIHCFMMSLGIPSPNIQMKVSIPGTRGLGNLWLLWESWLAQGG